MPVLVIDHRFCGPPGTGNGGYVAGCVARPLAGAAEVTLRRPVPLGRALELESGADGVALRDGETILAEARPAALELEAPPAPSFAEAAAAAQHYVGFQGAIYSECFVCGPGRAPGDGLRVFAGRFGDDGAVAAPFLPDASLADPSGAVRSEFLWAALDCPGAFALMAGGRRNILLGRFVARVETGLRAGERCTVRAWRIGEEGRKLHAGSAVYGEDGAVRGLARATWIEMRAAARPGFDCP